MGDFHVKHHVQLSKRALEISDSIRANIRSIGIVETVKKIYKEVEGIKKQNGIDNYTTCSKSCSFCCHDEILVSEAEANYIVKEIDRLLANKEVLEVQNSVDSINELKWAQRKCSMLDEDSNCKIYDQRPLICRLHNSADDPELCNLGEDIKNADSHRQLYSIETESMQYALINVSGGRYRKLHELLARNDKQYNHNLVV